MMRLVLGLVLVLLGESFGALDIIHRPESIHLPDQGDGKLYLTEIPLIYSQLLGLSAEKPNEWKAQGDLLNRPECGAVFVLDSPEQFKPDLGVKNRDSYKVLPDYNPDFEGVIWQLEKSFDGKGHTIMQVGQKVEGTNKKDLLPVPVESVKTKKDPLRQELLNIKAVTRWLENNPTGVKNGVPDFFLFRITGLLPIIQKNKADEVAMAQADIAQAVKEVSEELKRLYGGQCFIGFITQGSSHSRTKRQADGDTEKTDDNPKGIYDFYSPNYPVAFHMILWVMVFISLTILFVGVGMWFMDPGKDSIIYRMTMTRAKKD